MEKSRPLSKKEIAKLEKQARDRQRGEEAARKKALERKGITIDSIEVKGEPLLDAEGNIIRDDEGNEIRGESPL